MVEINAIEWSDACIKIFITRTPQWLLLTKCTVGFIIIIIININITTTTTTTTTTYVLTAVEFSLRGSDPYTSTDKNNKYT